MINDCFGLSSDAKGSDGARVGGRQRTVATEGEEEEEERGRKEEGFSIKQGRTCCSKEGRCVHDQKRTETSGKDLGSVTRTAI